ncbi:MAG TPA: hypothetical protein VGK32_04875 [Vicinamibacterales bacterium]
MTTFRSMTRVPVATGAAMPAPSYGYAWWIGQAGAGEAGAADLRHRHNAHRPGR